MYTVKLSIVDSEESLGEWKSVTGNSDKAHKRARLIKQWQETKQERFRKFEELTRAMKARQCGEERSRR